jgi:C1A family cysteine protease
MPGMKKPKEKRYIFTYRKDPYDERDFLYQPLETYADVADNKLYLPSGVDWTDKMSPIKDQGMLGSCVAFAVTAVKEFQEQTEHAKEVAEGKFDHRNKKYYDLSESWLYWMCKEIDAWPGVEGTSIRYAMKVLNRVGVPCEYAWPYDDVVKGEPKSWAHLVARWSIIDSYWRVTSLEELKDALVGGPVAIGVGVYEEFFSAGDDGIVKDPANPQYCYGGHAIATVGYDDAKQQVKFKNSWGPSWGDNGYGYFSYNYIRNYMWDSWTCRDMSVTRELMEGARSLL